MKEMSLYDTVVLATNRHRDAAGHWRPDQRDLLIQEIVKQVLAWPMEKQTAVRKRLGPPALDVAVVTEEKP